MLRNLIFGLFFMVHHGHIFAQNRQQSNERQEPLSLHGAALMQGIYPGFKVGIERPISTTEFLKYGKKIKEKKRAVLFYTGMYHHSGFHTNFFVGSEYIFRRIGNKGGIREFRSSIALSRTFLGAATYQVDNAGNVGRRVAAGNWYLMPGLTLGIGKDFSKTASKKPIATVINLNLSGLTPYNGLVLPVPTLELGVRYHLNSGKRVAISVHQKTKQRK